MDLTAEERRRYDCIHCGRHSVVPCLNHEHEQRCLANPERKT